MKIFEWRKNQWYRYAMIVMTVVAVIVLAANPEFRLLLPLVDALGLDLLLLIMGAQLFDSLKPLLNVLRNRVAAPLVKNLWSVVVYFLGVAGPYADARVRLICRVA